jgi:hypothetical protein
MSTPIPEPDDPSPIDPVQNPPLDPTAYAGREAVGKHHGERR